MLLSVISAALALLCAGVCLWSLRRQPPTVTGAVRQLAHAVEKEGILRRRVEALESRSANTEKLLTNLLRHQNMADQHQPGQQ